MHLTGKNLLRYWAALVSDIEKFQGKFLAETSFKYETFCHHAREMKFLLILNTAVRNGKFQDEHYSIMMTMLLDIIRECWLGTRYGVNEVAPPSHLLGLVQDETLVLKRKIFGCYLMYSMWINQPYIDDLRIRARIKMDVEDIRNLRGFIESYRDSQVLESSVKLGLAGMIATLRMKDAFRWTVDSKEYGIELWKRILYNNMRGDLAVSCLQMRDVQDHLAYSTTCRDAGQRLVEAQSNKNMVKEFLGQTIIREVFDNLQGAEGIVALIKYSDAMTGLNLVNEGIKRLTKDPILTIDRLTSHETERRVILAETRRRMKRRKERVCEEPKPSKSPYLGQGRTFGSKKDEVSKDGIKRERGMCSGNLWTFISEKPFDRPLGHVRVTNTGNISNAPYATSSDRK